MSEVEPETTAPYIPLGAKSYFHAGGRTSVTADEAVFLRLDWAITEFRDFVWGHLSVYRMRREGTLQLPERPAPAEHASGTVPDDKRSGRRKDPDAERSRLLGIIFTQTKNLLEMAPEGHAPFIMETAYRVERWALDGNDLLAEIWAPQQPRPAAGQEPKPLASVRVAELPSLREEKAFGRWMYTQPIALRHRLLICAKVIIAVPVHPSSADEVPLPASYFIEKYQIADDTLRKAREAGRIRGIKPHGRWLYFESDVRREFAPAVAEAEEKRKEKERTGNRPKGERQQ